MTRTRAYDTSHVLEQAMELFWRRGYHATSVRDLVAATGLKPGSLYAAFGGKRQLFQHVLDRYHQANIEQIREHLQADASASERIRLVFNRLLQRCREDLEGKGCLMANTIVELSCTDAELSRRANALFEDIELELTRVIEEGQASGDIPPGRPAPALARYLVMGIHGIRVYSRGNLDASHLRALADETLAVITAARRPGLQ